MHFYVILGILSLYGGYVAKANVHTLEQNDRAYLPPVQNKQNNRHLLSSNEELSIKSSQGYQYNHPKVIDDPLPVKRDYYQPLYIDFLDGKYKPLFEGDFFSDLFRNEHYLQPSAENQEETTIIHTLKANENQYITINFPNAQFQFFKPNSHRKPFKVNTQINYRSSNQRNKYNNNFETNFVLINHYEDTITSYELFNFNDASKLNGLAPVVIFQPGDDLSFIEDNTVIDDYEHLLPKSKKDKPTTNTISSTTTTTTVLPPLDSQSPKGLENSTIKNENNYTGQGHGYFYDKPKIQFTF